MFGLENISYWQFAKTVAMLLVIYYFSVLIYLYLRSRKGQMPRHFEEENKAGNPDRPKVVLATDLPSKKAYYSESNSEALVEIYNDQEDRSGMELEGFIDPQLQDKAGFQEGLKDVIKHRIE